MSNPPTLAEFKEAVRNEFGYLCRDFGFREVEPTLHLDVNPFCIWFANATTLVEVEGINWGYGAEVILGSVDSDAEWSARIPLWAIIQQKRPDLYHELESSTGQLADIFRAAILLRKAASDVLKGDFTVLRGARSIFEARVIEDRNRSQAEMREHSHRTAVAEAARAFRLRDYQRVIELLTPHEKLLSAAERAKLHYARSHLREG